MALSVSSPRTRRWVEERCCSTEDDSISPASAFFFLGMVISASCCILDNGVEERIRYETSADDGMEQNELEEPHDDFVVEITDVHQDDNERSPKTPRCFRETWALFPRYRRQTMAVAIWMGLALLIVVFALPPGSQFFLSGLPSTVEPSLSYFGLDANPPWGSLLVDGKRAALSSRGAYTLFRLPRGHHTLTWSAAPFAPQQCRIAVPRDVGETTCQISSVAPHLGDAISAFIRFPTNLALLSADQRTALLQATQAVLDRQQSSETVQAGEAYAQTSALSGTNTPSCTIVLERLAICFAVAHQPLKATLLLQLDTDPFPATPCANGACDSGNQGCRLFCDVPAYVGSMIMRSPAVWQASIQVQLLWQFATQDGRLVAEKQADSFILGQQNALTVPLKMTWNGMRWAVTLDRQSSEFGSDNPTCQATVEDLSTLVFDATPPNTDLRMVSGPTSASGCLISVPLGAGVNGASRPTPTPSMAASVIQRFGVLLAVNAVAHRLWPFLPMANVSTQRLAQQWITRG